MLDKAGCPESAAVQSQRPPRTLDVFDAAPTRCARPVKLYGRSAAAVTGEGKSPRVQPRRPPRAADLVLTSGAQTLDLIRIIIAIILPPLGVFLQVGIGKHFWINILLTLLGYIPGIIHAVWIIAKK